MATIEELEKRRAERRAKHDKGRTEQEALDLEAIDRLEEERDEPLHTMTANVFKAGAAVRLAFRSPTAAEYKRYCDMVGRAQEKKDPDARRKAQELLGVTCLLYPGDGKFRLDTFEALPGVAISVGIEAAKVAELSAENEGKG